MELVPADFLKFSVELTLREFFRVVRTVKATALSETSVKSPMECGLFLADLFDGLTADLSDATKRIEEEAYYRLRVARQNASTVSVERAISFEVVSTPGPRTSSSNSSSSHGDSGVKKAAAKFCLGDFGAQLGATKYNGRAYACGFGKDCTFKHVPVDGKPKKKLLEMAESLSGNAQRDIVRAVQARK